MTILLLDRKRVTSELDRVTIAETPASRVLVLGQVLGYAIGGLRALGVSPSVIRDVCEQSIVCDPTVEP